MSGVSYTDKCPNCGNDTPCYQDRKPFSYIAYFPCYECGLMIQPQVRYMDLETLNEYRGDNVENFWWYDIEPEEFFENWDEDDLQEFLKDNENLTKEEFEEMFEELKENWYGPVELNVLPDQNHDLSW